MKTKRVAVFGIFDGIHDGHRHFFTQALQAASGQAKAELIAIVGRDSVSLKLKGKKPKHSEAERLEMVLAEPEVFLVFLGDEEQSSYKILGDINPDMVCVGYDQKALFEDLLRWIRISKKQIKLVRLKPFQPEKYHTSLSRR